MLSREHTVKYSEVTLPNGCEDVHREALLSNQLIRIDNNNFIAYHLPGP